jgi:hypothetical protein
VPLRIQSSGLVGVDALAIDVEVDVAEGVFGYETVGLPDTAVRESKQRVKVAIRNAGFDFPKERVIVNLSPADLCKEGTAFDLPIALGILGASQQLRNVDLSQTVVVGELSLAGAVRPVRGVLNMVHDGLSRGMKRWIVPDANASEAAAVPGVDVTPASTLLEVAQILTGQAEARPVEPAQWSEAAEAPWLDMKHIRGQQQARRAVEIAAAGGHAFLMSGPPGAGQPVSPDAVPSGMPASPCYRHENRVLGWRGQNSRLDRHALRTTARMARCSPDGTTREPSDTATEGTFGAPRQPLTPPGGRSDFCVRGNAITVSVLAKSAKDIPASRSGRDSRLHPVRLGDNVSRWLPRTGRHRLSLRRQRRRLHNNGCRCERRDR